MVLFTDEELDFDIAETYLFDFSTGPLRVKTKNICRIFYNNINGMEINDAIGKAVQQSRIKQQE